jgi:Family of unknown function (DUF6186)
MTSRALTIDAHLIFGAALVQLEVLARLTPLPVPTAAAVLHRALRHRSAQFGILLAWWWLAWHFLVG